MYWQQIMWTCLKDIRQESKRTLKNLQPTDSLNGPAYSEMLTYQPLLWKFMFMKVMGNDLSLNWNGYIHQDTEVFTGIPLFISY